MTIADIMLAACLVAFVAAWWVRPLPFRKQALAALAVAAIGVGAIGVLDDRWQAAVGVLAGAIFLAVLFVNLLRKTDRRNGVPFVSGAAFALLAAAGIGALALFPVDPLPRPDGPHAVGVRSFELVDESRRGVIAAGAAAPRRLLVRVWYPAGDVTGLEARPYFTTREAHTTAQGLGSIAGFPQFFSYLKHVRTNSFENAPLMDGARELPVVMYSHGYTAFLSQNTALMEHMASHGYIVFSLQHTYDSSATVFPNGDVAPMDPALIASVQEQARTGPTEPLLAAMAGATLDERLDGRLRLIEASRVDPDRITRSAPIWLADRLFMHDALQRGDVPEDILPILAAANLDRVGEMGMSFGGSTAGAVCYVDARCAAAVNLDGGDYHVTPFDADAPVPFLMMHSDMALFYKAVGRPAEGRARGFNEFSYERIATAGARDDDLFRFQIRGSQHLGYSDFSLFMRRPVRDGLLGATPPRVMIGAQNAFVRGFFDRYLRGEQNGFPEPQVAAYADWVAEADNSDLPAWWAAKSEEDRATLEARIAAARGEDRIAPHPH